jgi:arabinofuranan 3-O-arabinosyltransferase
VPTRVGARTAADLLAGRAVPIVPCATDGGARLRLAAGTHRLRLAAGPWLGPLTVVLTPGTVPATVRRRAVRVRQWSSTARTADVGPSGRSSVLAVAENLNDGWRATLDGTALRPIRIDGWQQGWIVPAGRGGTVRMTYGPRVYYWGGLAAGLLAALMLVLLFLRSGGARAPRQPPGRSPGEAPRQTSAGGWWLPGAGAAALVVAGLAGALRPYGGAAAPWAAAAPVQALGWLAVASAAVAAVRAPAPRPVEHRALEQPVADLRGGHGGHPGERQQDEEPAAEQRQPQDVGQQDE